MKTPELYAIETDGYAHLREIDEHDDPEAFGHWMVILAAAFAACQREAIEECISFVEDWPTFGSLEEKEIGAAMRLALLAHPAEPKVSK